MKKTVIAGLLLVVLVEAVAVLMPDRRVVAWGAGAAVAVLMLTVRWALRDDMTSDESDHAANDAAELLVQWRTQTDTLIQRAETTRLQWDRHLRPRLAREFAAATGHRQAADRAAFVTTGRMLFGSELWQWVDPDNVIGTGAAAEQPGPGRDVLDEILRRLERL
ncbi:hypothetical protein [Mycobacterium sp. NPDC050441]|uniref:hypothetical protein n=1 Tax=Mycobacterium sp. NPDC050441 TaxID=3155403 RepID=UPI0033D12841